MYLKFKKKKKIQKPKEDWRNCLNVIKEEVEAIALEEFQKTIENHYEKRIKL